MKTTSLRHKVTFQQAVTAKNGYGEEETTWTDITPDEWVQIIPLKGDERYHSDKLNTTVDHKIRMRYRSGIDSTMRIVYGTRVFDIDSVLNPYERSRELQIMATEVFDV